MPEDVGRDQLALIRIEGMHCHKCEKAIQKSMLQHPGVHEVEVDFASGQASVLFDSKRVSVKQLTQSVSEAGTWVSGSGPGIWPRIACNCFCQIGSATCILSVRSCKQIGTACSFKPPPAACFHAAMAAASITSGEFPEARMTAGSDLISASIASRD